MPGRLNGAPNWRKVEIRRALDIISVVKPIGAHGWLEVTREYGNDRPHLLVCSNGIQPPIHCMSTGEAWEATRQRNRHQLRTASLANHQWLCGRRDR